MNEVEQQQKEKSSSSESKHCWQKTAFTLKNELQEGNENICDIYIFKSCGKIVAVSLLLTVINCLHYDCL